jgi:hypothetical protein
MRSSVRRIRWATTERSGTPQINKLVSELVMCCSAVDIKYHGTPNSTTPKIAIHLRLRKSVGHWCWEDTTGTSKSAAGAVRSHTSRPGST